MKRTTFLLLCLLAISGLHAQTGKLGDMNNDGDLTVGDITMLVDAVCGKAPAQSIVSKNDIVGEWFFSDGSPVNFGDNGTAYWNESLLYEFMPAQGHIILYKADGTLQDAWTVIKLNDALMIVRTSSGVQCLHRLSQMELLDIQPSKIMGSPGEHFQLSVTSNVLVCNNVMWTTSNASVATVDANGLVTLVAPGDASVTCVALDGSGVSKSIFVKVNRVHTPADQTVHVQGLSLPYHDLNIYVGDVITLTPTLSPANATNQAVDWYALNDGLLRLTTNGVITALAPGETYVRCASRDNPQAQDTCHIRIIDREIVRVEELRLSHHTVNLYVGDTITISRILYPENATTQQVSWYANDFDVIKVQVINDRTQAIITGKAAGEAIIQCVSNDNNMAFDTCYINVKEREMAINWQSNLIRNVSQLSSPWSCSDAHEGNLANVIDNDASTYWYGAWEDGPATPGTQYIEVEVADLPAYFAYGFTRRTNLENDTPTRIAVYGVPSNNLSATKAQCTLLDETSFPFTTAGETLRSGVINSRGYTRLRFYCEESTIDRGYFTLSELGIYPTTAVQ